MKVTALQSQPGVSLGPLADSCCHKSSVKYSVMVGCLQGLTAATL